MFSWLHDHRRRALLDQPFPTAWLGHLAANVRHYARLSEAEQSKLCDDLRILIAEKNWEGCGGLVMTEEVQVTVAAQAGLLLLGWEHAEYTVAESILVYPTTVAVPKRQPLWQGLWGGVAVEETLDPVAGLASSLGAVVLAWDDVLAGGRHPDRGHNVVVHEFAHLLDFQEGHSDGVHHLHGSDQRALWAEVMTAEYNALVQAVQAGHPSLLDAYGATNAAEFFAVATECFFCKPRPLRDTHPRLYAVLQDYYRQDPAARSIHDTGMS